MRISQRWSHLGGGEIIDARFSDALRHVVEAVSASHCAAAGNAATVNAAMRSQLSMCSTETGWDLTEPVRVASAGRRDPQPYPVLEHPRDFVPVSLRIELTPAGFCDAADIEDLYRRNEADVGVMIIPAPALARRLYPDMPDMTWLLGDYRQFARRLPTVPMLVLSIDA